MHLLKKNHKIFRNILWLKRCNPNLGIATKARACKVAGQEGSLGITSHAPGSVGKCEEWTLTLPKELSFWELESRWTSKFSKGDYRGQNPMDWRVFYIIEKLLECKCLKWACVTHFDTSYANYGQKKGRESNCQFDPRLLKVRIHPDFLAWRWCATYRWKALNESYNFAFDVILIKGLQTKLWAPKVGTPATLGISGLPLWGPRTKCYLGVSPMARHRVYYKGEGCDFPQVRVVVSLVSPNLPVARPSTKSAPTMH